MTTTATTLVAVHASQDVRTLAGDLLTAAIRATKSDPGDRIDIARYERLCTALERHAHHAADAGAPTMRLPGPPAGPHLPVAGPEVTDPLGPGLLELLPPDAADQARTWLDAGHLVIAVTTAHTPGDTPRTRGGLAPSAVAATWRAPDGVNGAAAVEARFRAQVTDAVTQSSRTAAGPGTRAVIDPSGVHNRLITTVLREHAAGSTRIDVRVAYEDGSAATHPFPLHALDMVDDPPARTDIDLHLVLLSIRHTEMDAVVDGAWLRNAEVSRPRPRAETDDFVYATSLAQLIALTSHGNRTATVHLYQTGLDAAIVGFYRSVVTHLFSYPGTLTVVPMFARVARDQGTSTFQPGRPWCTRSPR